MLLDDCQLGIVIPLSLNSFGSSLFGLILKADEVLEAVSPFRFLLSTPFGTIACAPSS